MPDIFISPKHEKKDIHRPHSHQIAPGIFSAFVHHPHKFTFIHQDKDEKIILFARRHFITNIPWIIIAIIATIMPLFLIPLIQQINLPFLSLSYNFTIIILLFYYILVSGFVIYNFVDWFYNIGLITQKRIMDIDFTHLAHIDVAITQLPEIEDVVYKQKGVFASFFDYGDVIAHTVPAKEDFVFESVPRPSLTVDIISKLIAD